MNEVKLIIFDLDNTLVNYGGVTKKAWQLTCTKLKESIVIQCSVDELVDKIMKVNDGVWNDENKRPKGNFSFYDLRKSIVLEAFSQLHIDNNDAVRFLVDNYAYYKNKAIYVFEDVFETLQLLKKKGYTLALLTNGDAQTQREKLKRFDLEPLFDGIFIDGEQGVGKPEKAAYDNVCQTFHVKAHEACMIGDHFLWEVVAPIRYGMHAIWVKRDENQTFYDDSIEPDAIIHQIRDLLYIF